jgi:hypothetical protein
VASSAEVTLVLHDNAILDSENSYEKRRVTVKASYGVNDEYEYRVKNLAKAALISSPQ